MEEDILKEDNMKTVIVSAGVIIDNGKVLITQRKGNSLRGFLWEFPGGKVEEWEEPRQALRRELKEELDVDVEVGRIFEVVFHSYKEYPILLLAYHCEITKGSLKPLGCLDFRWVSIQELERWRMAEADEQIKKLLCMTYTPILSEMGDKLEKYEI